VPPPRRYTQPRPRGRDAPVCRPGRAAGNGSGRLVAVVLQQAAQQLLAHDFVGRQRHPHPWCGRKAWYHAGCSRNRCHRRASLKTAQ
jgi:hypothetical protein